MKRWLTLVLFALLALVVIGCSQNKPAPTITPGPTTAAVVQTATEESSATALPPTPTEAATAVSATTNTPALTATSVPTDTPAATPSRTRAPATAKPRATATNAAVALKYNAPVLLEPHAGDTRQASKDDFLFKWQPVANLGANECYQVTVQVINLADPNHQYGQDSFLAQNTCNSAISQGIMAFSLLKKNPPSYSGLIARATQLGGPSNQFDVKWWVMVVRSDGTPLSPASEPFDFMLND